MYLQVKNNSLLTTENSRGVREQGIKDSKITCINLNPMHDSILVHIKQRPLASTIKSNPASRRLCLLLHKSLWVSRDNATLSSHPLTLYLQPLQINHIPKPNSKLESKPQFKLKNSIQNDSIRPTVITDEAEFDKPLLHISSNTIRV